MTVDASLIIRLVVSVATLFCFMAVGFAIKKFRLISEDFAKSLSVLILYVAQIALFLHSYTVPFKKEQALGLLQVTVISFVIHAMFYVLAVAMFRKCPEKIRKINIFAAVFSNTAYMGLPLIESVLGGEYTIYATVYLIAFNAFSYTLGRMIYTGDKSYISVKKIFINPAIIPIGIGLVLYLSGAGGWLYGVANASISAPELVSKAVSILYSVMTSLKNMVAPVSMIIIGTRLADVDFGSAMKDKHMYPLLAVRHFVFPFLTWGLCRLCTLCGIMSTEALVVTVILSMTPAASATSIFAELYGGDGVRAGRIVAVSTLLSIVSMPLVCFLLYI